MSVTAIFPGDCDQRGRIAFDILAQVTAYCAKTFAGHRVDVEIRLRKAKRTDRQNRLLHRALGIWAREQGLDVEQLKDDLLKLCFGVLVRQDIFTGEIVTSLAKPHTAGLSVEEFSTLFDVAVVEAAKKGHIMELPEDYKARRPSAA